jgi:hydroxymethylglutaryl-CoA synthase
MVKRLNIGITGFGCYIPRFRIRTEDIAVANNQNVDLIKTALLINEKTVPNKDEDSISIGIEACKNALLRASIQPSRIKAIYMGSESHPYAVKASSAVIGGVLGIGGEEGNFTAADTEFACKAGTAALQMIAGQVEAEMIDYGLAIGADTSQGAPGDALEYSAAAGGAAFIIGKNKKGKEESAANILYTLSKTIDTPDFWRRNNEKYPTHMGRFTGEEAYFKHITSTTQTMLDETGLKIYDFDHVILHQPNGKFPLKAAKMLGITKEQLKFGIVVHEIGNTYSGSSLLGLVNVLENALPGQRILLTSYGSGSGSDCFVIETTDLITEKQRIGKKLLNYLQNKQYVNYNQYRQMVKMIH